MKTLFLVFYGFQEYNGISKKIRYQADALRLCGADVRTCHYEVGNDGSRKWMIDEDVLADLGKGIPAKIKKVLIYISTLENHRKGWSREIPEPVFSIYLTILFPLLSKQKPKTYLYRLLLLPCC